mmetsp:Transcript_34408/g.53701  ORF Transcript_34408/g.53701 Transcript_34408/m.53701 type:complete len:204 (-) Transcript_34408:107-718(-)
MPLIASIHFAAASALAVRSAFRTSDSCNCRCRSLMYCSTFSWSSTVSSGIWLCIAATAPEYIMSKASHFLLHSFSSRFISPWRWLRRSWIFISETARYFSYSLACSTMLLREPRISSFEESWCTSLMISSNRINSFSFRSTAPHAPRTSATSKHLLVLNCWMVSTTFVPTTSEPLTFSTMSLSFTLCPSTAIISSPLVSRPQM